MNKSQTTTKKAIALFLSLGMMSSLAGCEVGSTDNEGGEGSTEQPASSQDEGGESGEDD